MAPTLQETILLCIDAPLFCFHISVIIHIFTKIVKKDTDFQGGFYVIWLTLAIVDSFAYLNVSLEVARFSHRVGPIQKF